MTRTLALRALAAYLVLRAVSAVMIVIASRDQVAVPMWTDGPVGYFDMTTLWDGYWYRTIAEDGYPEGLPTGQDGLASQNAWAFYPLFPYVSRLIMAVTGLPFAQVGSTLALVCGALAAVLMAGLLARRVGDRTALLAVVLWAAVPASPALQIAYTEGPAMLALVGFLWQVERRRWLAAGLIAVVIGVTRPIAVPLAVVLAVALFLRWRSRRHDQIPGREYLAGTVGLAATGLSGLIWPAIVWWGSGSPTGYTDTMASWRAGHVIEPFKPWVGMSHYVLQTLFEASPAGSRTWGPVVLALGATALVVAICGPWARGLGWVLRAWCLAYPAYLVAVLDPYTSTFRYLVPLFPIAVLAIGGGWASGREVDRGMQVFRFVVLLLISLGLQWIWVSQLLVFVPPTDAPP